MDIDAKEKALLLKVRELLFRHGVKDMTMDWIAQKLKISKKTIYKYVSNKTELLTKIMKMSLEDQRAQYTELLKDETNPIDRLFKIHSHNMQFLEKINPAFFSELNIHFYEIWAQIYAARKDFLLEAISRNLFIGIESGFYRSEIDVDLTARIYLSFNLERFNQNIFPAPKYQTTDTRIQILMYHIRAIVSHKGLDYIESDSFRWPLL